MKFYLKLIMEGSFPGSPDTDHWEISEAAYDLVRDMMAIYRRVDKLEED